MPFNFLRRGTEERPEEAAASEAHAAEVARGPRSGVAFDGLTEDWRLVGLMQVEGRLSDALNRRDSIALAEVSWAPIDGSAGFTPVPGLRSIDPYDLVVVLAGEGTLPPLSEAERAAVKVHKVAYDLVLDAPPFRIEGTVFLFPGGDPARLVGGGKELFIPVTDAALYLGDRPLEEGNRVVVLVNRSYLRAVEQLDGGPAPGPEQGAAAAEDPPPESAG